MPQKYVVEIIKNEYGGIIDRGNANQINSVSSTYDIKSFIKDLTSFETLETFFDERNGHPFIFESKTFRCLQRSWTIENNLWTLDAVFEEIKNV